MIIIVKEQEGLTKLGNRAGWARFCVRCGMAQGDRVVVVPLSPPCCGGGGSGAAVAAVVVVVPLPLLPWRWLPPWW